jgi:DNA-binding HxlR family transcriptional regulator
VRTFPRPERIFSGPSQMDMPADSYDCDAVSEVLGRVGDKWTVLVVVVLRDRPRRFNDLKRQVHGISQQMLTRALKALERDRLVSRTVHSSTPPHVEYALTELGFSLSEAVRPVADWAVAHVKLLHDSRFHVKEGEAPASR